MGAKFDKLEAKLSGEKGVTDPAGLAASIGRKKYGKENYDKAAAKDKSPKMKKSDWDELDGMAEEVEKAYGVKAGKGLFGKPPKARGVGISQGSGSTGGYGIKKGGVGSGKKGHKTQADLEGLKGNMGRHHIMQYGDKGSAFSESDRQGKSEVFHHEPTNSYHVVTEGGGVNHLKDHPNFKRLGAPYKGDPAAEGNKASRQDASGTRPKSDLGKSEIELEIDELSKTMEFATMNPVEEIKKAVMELGPEGLRKAMPDMSDENKELLNDILEDMSKSHTLPIDPPKKLVNVGGENYVEEDVMNDDADEDVFDAAVKEGDNEQKHQGGSHDLTQPVDWEGQMIKSLDEFTAEELATFGEIYKAMKMKKDEDKKEDKDMDKAVSASPKLWGSTKPRGVGIYKGEEDDSVAEDVKEIKGDKKVNEVMDEAAPDKKDDILRELRDKKMKKAKEMIKAALKKECPDMMEEKEESEVELKKKIKKALIMALNEEYTDEEIAKAKKAMKKGDEERYESDEKYDKDEAAEAYEGRDDAEKKGDDKKAEKYEKDIESDMTDADYDKDKSEGKKKFEKAMNLFTKSQELLDEGEKEIATELFLKAKKMVADVLEMNPGIKKLSQPEPADAAKTTADAVKSPNMKKSIKWYGEENDKFSAGRLGRHNYTSSVNSYYDEMIKKSEEVKEEELMTKSFNPHDIEDLIEADLVKSQQDIQSDVQMEEFKKSQGNFTRNSFDEEDMFKSLNMTTKEAYEALGKSEDLAKAKFIRKIGTGKNARYVYQMPGGEHKVTGGKLGEQATKEGAIHEGKKAGEKARIPNWSAQQKAEIKDSMVSVIKKNKGKWVGPGQMKKELLGMPKLKEMLDTGANEYGRGQDLGPQAWTIIMNLVKEDKTLDTKLEGGKRHFTMLESGQRKDDSGYEKRKGKKAKSEIDRIMGR